jgi:hypothetical protein
MPKGEYVAVRPASASGTGIIRQRALPTADGGMTPLLFAIPMVTTTWSTFHPWMNLSHAPNQIASDTTPKGPEKRPSSAVPKRIPREPTSQEKSRTPCWLP